MVPPARRGAIGLAIVVLCTVAAAASIVCARQAWLAGLSQVPQFESAAATVQTLSQLGCVILTLIWLATGLKRVREAGAEGLSVGPVGAVLWWFVPLANLVMPAKAVSELRKAAIKPRNWEAVNGSFWIGAWWAFWLAAGVANAVYFRASLSNDGDLLAMAGSASFVGDILSVPAALLFAVVVWSIEPHLRDLGRSQSSDFRGAKPL